MVHTTSDGGTSNARAMLGKETTTRFPSKGNRNPAKAAMASASHGYGIRRSAGRRARMAVPGSGVFVTD